MADLAPDAQVESVQILAWNRHGAVSVLVARGTRTSAGGGPFENSAICVMLTDGERITHYEAFDVTDTDRALARFAELCAKGGGPVLAQGG